MGDVDSRRNELSQGMNVKITGTSNDLLALWRA